ncbi:MAG TPA: hypothetical protein VGK67_12435 [Myxococcales bacterium]|jgi:hypothetical protein
MSSDRSSSSSTKRVLIVGLVIGVPALVGAFFALRPSATPTPAKTEAPKPADPARNPPAAQSDPDPADPHSLHPLTKWDGPFAFDPLRYLPEATRIAREKYADASFAGLRMTKVKPNGRINLKAREAFAAYRFRSPSRSANGDTVGAEPCLVDVAVTGDAVQVLTPKVVDVGCSSPAVSVPECDLLKLWLVTLQERTPTEPLGTWELSAAPGAKPDAPAAPGQWTLTMPAQPEPFARSYDAACNPIGRTTPVTPVDADKFRADSAAPPRPPADPNAPSVAVRPVSVRGPLAMRALQDIHEGLESGFVDCYAKASASCGGCLGGVTSTLTVTIGEAGRAAKVDFAAMPLQSTPEMAVNDAAERFGRCTKEVTKTSVYPAATEITETVFKVLVAPARRKQHSEGERE